MMKWVLKSILIKMAVLMFSTPMAYAQCSTQDEQYMLSHASGIYELAGVSNGKAYSGTAMITRHCPLIMHRCVNGHYSKVDVALYTFPYPAESQVPGIQIIFNDQPDHMITYRTFYDLNNYSLLIGYIGGENYTGHESLIFQETDEFRCGQTCVPSDRGWAYNKDRKPCQ